MRRQYTLTIDYISSINIDLAHPKEHVPVRTSQSANDEDYARYCMQRWAIGMVSSMCLEEADALMRTRDNPLRMSWQTLSWAILHGWDIEHLRKYMQSHAPTIWRLMIDISKKRHQTGTEGNPIASQSRRAPEVIWM